MNGQHETIHEQDAAQDIAQDAAQDVRRRGGKWRIYEWDETVRTRWEGPHFTARFPATEEVVHHRVLLPPALVALYGVRTAQARLAVLGR